MRKALLLLCSLLSSNPAFAVIVDTGTVGGITPPAQTGQYTPSAAPIESSVPQVDASVTGAGVTKTVKLNEADIAASLMDVLTVKTLQSSLKVANPATPANCTQYTQSLMGSTGIPLNGQYYLCNHAEQTGYANFVSAQALSSYTVPVAQATGDDLMPANSFSVKGKAYTGYNQMVDDVASTTNAFAVASGATTGSTGTEVVTRLMPALLKSFTHMAVTIPDYPNHWAAQSQSAQAQFQTELNNLLGSIGVSATSPLPADFGAQVTTAFNTQIDSMNTNIGAATAAQTVAAQTAAAAPQASTAGSQATGSAVQAAIGGISVPAAQQPLLDSILADAATSVTQLAVYTDQNAKYVAAQKVYSTNLSAYNTEAANTGIIPKGLYQVAPWHCATDRNGKPKCAGSTTGFTDEWPGPNFTYGKPTSGGTQDVTVQLFVNHRMYPKFTIGGPGQARIPSGSTIANLGFIGGAVTQLRAPNTRRVPDATILANTKAAYTAAASQMATFKAARDAALAASNTALASAKTNLASLNAQLVLAGQNATAQATAANQQATTNLTNAMSGSASAMSITALNAFLDGLTGMVNMANNVTNSIVNDVTVADLQSAATTFKNAFIATKGLGDGLVMGDGVASSQDLANLASGGAPVATGGVGSLAPTTATAQTVSVNGLRDTPYRTLKDLKVAIDFLRTATTMIAVATQGGGMALNNYAPTPAVKPVQVKQPSSGGYSVDLKAVGEKAYSAIRAL